MSSVESLRPIFHQNIHLNSYQRHYHCHGLRFFRSQSKGFHQNASRFIPNFLPFSSADLHGPATSFSKSSERFNLWGDFGFRRNRIRASTQDSDSAAGSSGTSESEGNKNSQNSGSSSASNRRKEKQGKGNVWWPKGKKWQWQPIVQAQEIGVLLLQLGIVIFVMRLLRPGLPLPGSEPRTPTTFISVPYSDFLSKINSNQVHKVEVDGVHIMFKLKSEPASQEIEVVGASSSKLQESELLLRSVAPTKRIVYTTTRPSDIKAPYEKMLENAVEFGSPDKRSGGFLNSALVSTFRSVMSCYDSNVVLMVNISYFALAAMNSLSRLQLFVTCSMVPHAKTIELCIDFVV
jgi:cell division protease FtsH